MKRICGALLLALILLISGCAARGSSDTYTVDYDGRVLTVDTVNQTITDGADVYRYSFSGTTQTTTVQIEYPNGGEYSWTVESGSDVGFGYGGGSEDYDDDRYIPGSDLVNMLEKNPSRTGNGGGVSPLVGLLLCAVGIWNIAAPRTVWFLRYGWLYKNAEPSDFALAVQRIGGGVAVIIGVILLFV